MTADTHIRAGHALLKQLRDKDAPMTRGETAQGVADLIDALQEAADRNADLEAEVERLRANAGAAA